MTLRRRVPGGHLGDALGDLVALDDATALVATAHGRVEISLAAVVAARLVEPSTPAMLALEMVTARGWRPAETAWSPDGWLLRADGGVTSRANSALALRTPTRPLPEVVAQVRAWYAERGLPLVIALPLPARSLLDGALEQTCGLIGQIGADTHVFVGRLDHLLATTPAGGPDVELGPTTDRAWREVHTGAPLADSPVMGALLARHDNVVFATARIAGEVVAIGRAVVDAARPGRDERPGDRWLGITGLAVAPAARRCGLGRAVLRAMWTWGAEQGAERSYLQVASANQAAVALYLGAGYWHHHDYRYRRESQPSGADAASDHPGQDRAVADPGLRRTPAREQHVATAPGRGRKPGEEEHHDR